MPGSRKSRRTPPPARADVESLVFRWGAQIDPALLDLALTHRSWAHENGGLPTNERLEFLGDSVLSIVVTENLYRAHPDAPEGQLAKMRAATVSEPALAAVARDLGVGEFIKLGKGEALSGGRRKDSILADTVEALIGAAYLTHGLEPTREVVTRLVSRFLSAAPTRGAGLDWKTSLQELTAAHHLGSPSYEVVGEGPDHRRVFTATALVDGRVLGRGTGSSKKTAEHDAAEAAYAELLARHGDGGLDLPGVNEALRADLGLPDPGAGPGLPDPGAGPGLPDPGADPGLPGADGAPRTGPGRPGADNVLHTASDRSGADPDPRP